MRRGGSTILGRTARRCRGRLAPLLALLTTAATPVGRLAPLLALLATTAATPVDYTADQIIFEASKNLARFRRVSGPILVVAYD